MVPHKQVRDNGLEQRLKLEAMRADTACHRAAPPASAVRVNLECFFLFYFASDSLWSPAPASQYMIVHRERQLANLRASDLSVNSPPNLRSTLEHLSRLLKIDSVPEGEKERGFATHFLSIL